MITFDCPWCDAPVELAATMADLGGTVAARCDGCSVEVELAADPVEAVLAAAA